MATMNIQEICDFWNISEIEYIKLLAAGVTIKDLIMNIKTFNGNIQNNSIGCFALEHYIDLHGDFSESDKPHAKIAIAMYNSMDNRKKAEVLNYMTEIEEK